MNPTAPSSIKKDAIAALVVLVILVPLIAFFITDLQKNKEERAQLMPPPVEATRSIEHEIFLYDKANSKKGINNLRVLVLSPERDMQQLGQLARSIRSQRCTDDCNVILYSDKKTYDLEQERAKMGIDLSLGTPEKMQADLKARLEAFDKEHHEFIAANRIGSLFGEDFTK